ncbi:Electron transport complex protein rnfB [compost metagenome]
MPQTQCGKCGHPGYKPYAEGLAKGEAINKCPPGGNETIAALASLLQVPIIALDPERGSAPPQVAYIREAECIGCTKCIQACPVDAIVGAAKLMHTEALAARSAKRNHARRRFELRNSRLQREEARKQAERAARSQRSAASNTPEHAVTSDDPIKAAIERVKAQKAAAADAALKKAKIAAAMSRAQLNKARSAFGESPNEAQLAQLAELEQEAEQAQVQLLALQPATAHAGR